MEMHMVHVEDRFIGKNGQVDAAGAVGNKFGLAVLGIFFHVDPTKPQVKSVISYFMVHKCLSQSSIHILK